MKTALIALVGLLALPGFPVNTASADCPLSIETPFQAVPLSRNSLMGRMENENRLDELCPGRDKDCVAKALAPDTDDIPVHARPSGKVIARLRVVYPPGKGLSAELVLDESVFPFTPTIYDSDWGYGPPWFHATLLDSRKGWKKIVLPRIGSGWVHLPETDAINLLNLPQKVLKLSRKGRDHLMVHRNVVVVTSNRRSVTVRDEQPADMWCEGGDPPPLAPFTEEVIPLTDLYEDACNLLLAPAYTRGC